MVEYTLDTKVWVTMQIKAKDRNEAEYIHDMIIESLDPTQDFIDGFNVGIDDGEGTRIRNISVEQEGYPDIEIFEEVEDEKSESNNSSGI